MWAFCCIPNFGGFKNIHFCIFLLNLFKKKILVCIHKVQPFNMVLSFKRLFEKDLYLALF